MNLSKQFVARPASTDFNRISSISLLRTSQYSRADSGHHSLDTPPLIDPRCPNHTLNLAPNLPSCPLAVFFFTTPVSAGPPPSRANPSGSCARPTNAAGSMAQKGADVDSQTALRQDGARLRQ